MSFAAVCVRVCLSVYCSFVSTTHDSPLPPCMSLSCCAVLLAFFSLLYCVSVFQLPPRVEMGHQVAMTKALIVAQVEWTASEK